MQTSFFRTLAILFVLSICAGFGTCAAIADDKPGQLDRNERVKERNELAKLRVQLEGQGKIVEAIAAAEKVAAFDREVYGEGTVTTFDSVQYLATLYWKAGRLEDADRSLREAGAAWEKKHKETPHIYVMNLVYIGKLQKDMGKLERSESPLSRAYQIGVKLEKFDTVHADVARALADFYLQKGEFVRAEELFKVALKIRAEKLGTKHIDYALSLHDLSIIYLATGRSRRGCELLDVALPLLEANRGKYSRAYAAVLTTRAHLAMRFSELEQAKRLYLQAWEVYKKLEGEGAPATATSLMYVGAAACHEGKYAEAEQFLERAQIIFGNHPEKIRERIIILNNLAHLNVATGKLSAALHLETQALELQQKELQQIFSISTESGMYDYLATINGNMPRLTSLALLLQASNPAAASTALTWALRYKGIIVETMCQFRERERSLRDDIRVRNDPSLQQHVAAMERSREELTDLVSNVTSNVLPDFQERKQRLEQLIDSRERQVHQMLSAYFGKQIQPFQTATVDKVRGALPTDSVLVEVIRLSGVNFEAIGKQNQWMPARYLAFVLSADPQAAVRLVDLGPASVIDEAVQEFRTRIEQAPRELRASDEKTLEEDFRPVAGRLYQLVFAPLQPFIGKATMIYLSPDSELNRVPFQALVDEQDKYLIESYRFAYLATGRDLLRPRPISTTIAANRPTAPGPFGPRSAIKSADTAMPRGSLIFAGPDYDLKADQRQAKAVAMLSQTPGKTELTRGAPPDTRGLRWRPLPGAAAESEDLLKALKQSRYSPVRAYVGAEALEEVFKAIQPPRVLHIATHGFFLPDQESPADPEQASPSETGLPSSTGLSRLKKMENPLRRSGIVLAGANAGAARSGNLRVEDGYLTAEEISLMNLRGTELVVLSACETGLGDIRTGQGVYGLRHAFFHAGARSLVTSLFEVPDVETRDLMNGFYQSLVSGRGKLNSLHEAQLKMIAERRNKNGAAHPFFWASFVLVGDPS